MGQLKYIVEICRLTNVSGCLYILYVSNVGKYGIKSNLCVIRYYVQTLCQKSS